MMKRITAFALALALVLSLNTAFAWSCPSCGASMDGRFCSECGTKKPETICPSCGTNFGEQVMNFCTECGTKLGAAAVTAAPTATPAPTAAPTEAPAEDVQVDDLEILAIMENEDGSASIVWNAQMGKTYQVRYLLKQSDDVQADLRAANSIGYYYYESTIGVFTLSKLVPGESYWIGIFDEAGNGHYEPYVPAVKPQPFTVFDVTVYAKPTIRQNDEDTLVDNFLSSQIASDSGVECGLYLVLEYTNAGEECQPRIQVALEAPNGAKKVFFSSVHTFKVANNGQEGWNFFDLSEYVMIMEKYFDAVPEGEHKVTVYLDGEVAGTVPFQVQAAAATTAEPTAAPAVTDVDFGDLVTNADGTLTVSWSGGEAPYVVRYAEKRSDDYNADVEDATTFGRWIAESECFETTYTFKRLVPGKEYWISVLDKSGTGRYIAYKPEAAGVLEGYSTSMEIIPRSQVDGVNTNLTYIPADKAGLEDEVSYGAYLWMNYSNPGAEQQVLFQVVLTLPNGAVRVEKTATATLEAGTDKWLGWNFCDLEWYMGQVLERFGSIPVGDIKVEVYIDGKLAASGALPVGLPQPLTVTGVTDNGDGTYLLAWQDNGNGPYEVIYFERFSDDMEADQRDIRGSGRWEDASDYEQTQWKMNYLVPGRSYWITVSDREGVSSAITFDVPAAEVSAMGVSIEATPRKEENGVYTDLQSFSAAALNQEYTGSYGLYIDVDYPDQAEDSQKLLKVVLTLPNGAAFCTDSFDLNWYKSGFYWDLFSLDWAFAQVKRLHNGVLEGEYRLDFYAEGEYAAGVTFQVGK